MFTICSKLYFAASDVVSSKAMNPITVKAAAVYFIAVFIVLFEWVGSSFSGKVHWVAQLVPVSIKEISGDLKKRLRFKFIKSVASC